MDNTNNMGDYFDNFFSVIVANTPQLKKEVYQIRYQVYCEELQYEAKENFPEKMEQDKFDSRSIHLLLKHKASNSYVGCVRTVLADSNQPEELFPFEKLSRHNINFQQQPRKNFFEISRLAVVSDFRRRTGEENTSHGLLFFNDKPPEGTEEKRTASLIAMSLYLACTSIAVKLDLDAFTLMEPRLHRHLRLCGIPAHQIGNFVEFHGKRGPFLLKRNEVVPSMKPDTRELFNKIYNQINQSLLYTSSNVNKSKSLSSSSDSLQFFRHAYGLA